MTRCQRCGQETTEERCELCRKEQGVIGQSRLTDVIKVLETSFKERKHGFTIGEANNALPYNFTFTIEVLEKLRNLNILESNVVHGTKKYEFTGEKLESTHDTTNRLGLISDTFKKVPKVHSDFLPRASCKYCGGGIRYHQIVCSACRPKWLKDMFEMIKPVFDDKEKHPIPEIYPLMKGIKKSSSYGIIDEMVKKGWLNCEKIGRLKYYTLTEQPPARESIDEPVEIHPKIKKDWEDAKENKKKIKPNKKVYEKPVISKMELTGTPSIIQTLIQILPGLLNSEEFQVRPGDQEIQAKYQDQKTLLDLYETLPAELKNECELSINKSNTHQTITIALEGGK